VTAFECRGVMIYARGARSRAGSICIAHTVITADNASLKRGGILDQGIHSASSTPSDGSLPSPWRGGARGCSYETPPCYHFGHATYAATLLPNTTSSNDGSGLISGASSLADCSVVSTSAGSSLKSSALDGSGSQTSSPMSLPRSS
jgi:hypothetical protein